MEDQCTAQHVMHLHGTVCCEWLPPEDDPPHRVSPINWIRPYICVAHGASQVAQWWRIHLLCRNHRFDPWVKKISWRNKWQPTPVFLPGKFHGQRSLAGYSPWGHKESDTTYWLNPTTMFGSYMRSSLLHTMFIQKSLHSWPRSIDPGEGTSFSVVETVRWAQDGPIPSSMREF